MSKRRVLSEMMGEAAQWSLIDETDRAIAQAEKELLKKAKALADKAKQRLLAAGFKTKNLSVYIDFNKKPAYQFHLVDMRYDQGRTSEQVIEFVKGVTGWGGAIMPRSKGGEYDLRFELGK